MSLQPFSISKNFIHGTEDGCLRVTAVPHITIYRIPHDFALNLTEEKELKQAGIYLLMNSTAKPCMLGRRIPATMAMAFLAGCWSLTRRKRKSTSGMWAML